VKPQEIPAASDAAWVKSPIDAFVLKKLDDNGLKPTAPASKETLLRRATYDLIGLPPTPEGSGGLHRRPVAQRVREGRRSPPRLAPLRRALGPILARHRALQRHHRQRRRQGRIPLPVRLTYRDYVIKAFNDDKPYDKFLKEQLAADKLPDTQDDPTRLAALGFITVGKRSQNPNDTIDERIDAVTKGTMALTVACARCHDHKFDPIPTADYYSLHGIFASTEEPAEKPLIANDPNGRSSNPSSRSWPSARRTAATCTTT
jgi:hypothetical protein